MARKLKKSAMTGLKQKHEANSAAEIEQRKKTDELFLGNKQLMEVGQVADAITNFDNMLAARMPLTEAQKAELREMMTYFVERSFKRMKDYPHILQFMKVG